MNKIEGVYAVKNMVTGECYVGATKDIVGRYRKHMQRLRSNNHHNRLLQAAFIKYGECAFKLVLLEERPKSECKELEKEYIERLDSCTSGYNLTPLGAGPDYPTRVKIGARSKAGEANISGILADAQSLEGRKRRSETMKHLNATRIMRFKKEKQL